VVILAETRETNKDKKAQLHREIASIVSDLMGTAADEILLLPPHTVLKTSSGKIRRAASREQYEKGQLGQSRRAVWWQLLRMTLSSVLPQLRQLKRKILTTLFAGYAWITFLVLALLVWLLVVVLPLPKWRWSVIHGCCRLLLLLTRTRLKIEGIENIPPDRPFMLVSNHASYLDGLVLVTSLAQQFSFVVKQELHNNWFNRIFLQRINARFVERFDTQKSTADANQLVQHAHDKYSLVFFPEGTFTRMPGLLPFRMGAFSTAAKAGIVVVPVTIRGTRSILRAKSWFPRHGAVSVTISKIIKAEGTGWDSIIKLRDTAHAEILHQCGEPDLSEYDSINNYQRHS